jgi:hypothetical protein
MPSRKTQRLIVLVVVAGLTATEALANSPHLKKGRPPRCVITRSAISKSVSCRGVLARLALSTSAPDNNNDGNTLPYDEFGLGANQPNQPRVGSDGTQPRRDAAGLTAPTSAPDNNTSGNSTHCLTMSSGSAPTSRTSPGWVTSTRNRISATPDNRHGAGPH